MSLYDDVILPDVGINLNPSPNESNTSKASNPGTNSASSVTSAKPESDIASWNSNSLKLLQYQVEAARKRQASIQSTSAQKVLNKSNREKLASSAAHTMTPVIDLTEKRKPQLPLSKDPNYLSASSEIRFNVLTGKIEKEDDSLYVSLNEEYDPMKPNDYEKLVRQIRLLARQAKGKADEAATETERRSRRRHSSRSRSSNSRSSSGSDSSSQSSRSRSKSRDKHRKRSRSRDSKRRSNRHGSSSRSRSRSRSRSSGSSGDEKRRKNSNNDTFNNQANTSRRSNNMFAPPPSLIEANPIPAEQNDASKSAKAQSDGLVKAEKMMARMGYREGDGLGKNKQGMSMALQVEKTGLRTGKILHEKDIIEQALAAQSSKEPDSPLAGAAAQLAPPPPPPPSPAQQSMPQTPPASVGIPAEVMKNMSKVILLRNMVDPGDIDDDLENETKEECQKYGEVNRVIIFEIPKSSQEEAVRIFIEFKTLPSAIKALTDLNGRFFGGRKVKATFYNYDKFNRLELGGEVV